MFVSQERGAARKPFQKPNILRRKPRPAKLNTEKNNGFAEGRSTSAGACDVRLAPFLYPLQDQPNQLLQNTETPTFTIVSIDEMYVEDEQNFTLEFEDNDYTESVGNNNQEDGSNVCSASDTLNVESFLNKDVQFQKYSSNNEENVTLISTENKSKWCPDFIHESLKNTTEYYNGSQINGIVIDKSLNVCNEAQNRTTLESLTDFSMDLENVEVIPKKSVLVSQESYSKRNYVCDEPGCNKSFWTDASLEKHKNLHSSVKKPVVLYCPVTKTDADGTQNKCGKTFLVRRLLTKHLEEDHSPEDALYKCEKCLRQFFTAGGARGHAAGGCGRLYTCAWPGCGRAFPQPCRLREHARAHTGDRPYACHYPGCNWTFRSNSKLVRHARQHTGERRHVCAACGRAFLRREHLRDHAARRHTRTPHPHRCTHQDCDKSFASTGSLVAHVKKAHKKTDGNAQTKKQRNAKAKKNTLLLPVEAKVEDKMDTITMEPCEAMLEDNIQGASLEDTLERDGMLTDSLSDNMRSLAETGGVEDERCARVHCTWPLQRKQEDPFTLEEDAQVEQAGSESCESSIYTVRSDLFLHGNLLVNEDSEFIISRECGDEGISSGGDTGAAGAADALLDSHPTTDLTQEELMYADAVDESSFRVFLLNGEELTSSLQ